MSKWTEVRDSVLDALDVDQVTESIKEQMTASLMTDGIPALEAVATKFVTQIQTQAKEESGWNKIRDSIALPLLINGSIWLLKVVLKNTAPKAAA